MLVTTLLKLRLLFMEPGCSAVPPHGSFVNRVIVQWKRFFTMSWYNVVEATVGGPTTSQSEYIKHHPGRSRDFRTPMELKAFYHPDQRGNRPKNLLDTQPPQNKAVSGGNLAKPPALRRP